MPNKNAQISFETIYIDYYAKLYRFALLYVLNEEDAENLVQDVFLDLWRKKDDIITLINPSAYLFTSTKNRCIDLIRKRLTEKRAMNNYKEEYALFQFKVDALELFETENLSETSIQTDIHNAISQLPKKCKVIFIKSKLEGKKQKQIAQELNITINTVETQMGIAYKKLKKLLKNKVILIFLSVFS